MYYVPDGTMMCGFYECQKCSNRYLALQIVPKMRCVSCDKQVDMEIGPDEEMPVQEESAVLLDVIEGEDEVEKMDTLLSLAITGGDYTWI